MLLPMMIDERSEPYPTEHIEYEIYPSEHPRDEDGLGLEVGPEGDRKPEKHIGKSCYRGVCEDVCEEFLGIHRKGLSPFFILFQLFEKYCFYKKYPRSFFLGIVLSYFSYFSVVERNWRVFSHASTVCPEA